jgi:hypothetical protein
MPEPAGYSGTPLARKLGLKPFNRLCLVGVPAKWEIEGLPEGVRVLHRLSSARSDVIVAFFRDMGSLAGAVPRLAHSIVADGSLWLAWPRRAAGHSTDITDNKIRAAVLPIGLVDVKVAALDRDWSGLKMVWRKELRAGLQANQPLSPGAR